MDRYTEITQKVENNFRVPNYLEQKIKYVSNKESADICVSARHTFGDYLIVGIAALLHSINGVSGDILVYNDNNPATEIIGIAKNSHAPLEKVSVNSELFLQVSKTIDTIYDNLINSDTNILGVGLSITSRLSIQFSDFGEGIPKNIMDELQFTHFDDLLTAQKNAFTLIKKMVGSMVAGTTYALENGD